MLILAGGRGTRMGGPKHLAPFRGATLLGWMRGRLGPAFAETLVCGVELPDLHPGLGPLAGLEAGLTAMRYDVALAIAVDLPRVTPELAGDLVALLGDAQAAVPRTGGRPQPLCAVYRRSALPVITAALETGELRATALLDRLVVRWLDEEELRSRGHDPAQLANVNTPEELARAERA